MRPTENRKRHTWKVVSLSWIVSVCVFVFLIERSKRKLSTQHAVRHSRFSPPRLTDGFQWIDADDDLENITLRSSDNEVMLENYVLRYLKRLQVTCPTPKRFGNPGDGGWDACLAGPFNISKPCLVYSFGISNDWTFDDVVTTNYQCQDMAYDPSIGKSDHKRNSHLWFFGKGIGAVDTVNQHNWQIRSYPSLLALNQHTETTVDILKMDVEYAEWESLETMLKAPDCLRKVKQFMWEFHLRETWGQQSTASDLVRYWNIARGLDRLGFKVWKVWDNPGCVFASKYNPGQKYCYCANVHYINVEYFR